MSPWYPCCAPCECISGDVIDTHTFTDASSTWNLIPFQSDTFYPDGCGGVWKLRLKPEGTDSYLMTGLHDFVDNKGKLENLPDSLTYADLTALVGRPEKYRYPFCVELIVCCIDVELNPTPPHHVCPEFTPKGSTTPSSVLLTYDAGTDTYKPPTPYGLTNNHTYNKWRVMEHMDCTPVSSGNIAADGTRTGYSAPTSTTFPNCPNTVIVDYYYEDDCLKALPDDCVPTDPCLGQVTITITAEYTGKLDLYIEPNGAGCDCVLYYGRTSSNFTCGGCVVMTSPGSATFTQGGGDCVGGGPYTSTMTATFNFSKRRTAVSFNLWWWTRDNCGNDPMLTPVLNSCDVHLVNTGTVDLTYQTGGTWQSCDPLLASGLPVGDNVTFGITPSPINNEVNTYNPVGNACDKGGGSGTIFTVCCGVEPPIS